MSKVQYKEGALESLENQRTQLNHEIQALKRELERNGSHRFTVQYRDPDPGFDRRKVKGTLCTLFDVRDQKYAGALSAAGGGSLYNLVVENESVSKAILERGNLQTRLTVIPMNKVRGGCIQPQAVKVAQNLVGADNCIPALDLIEYDKSLRVVMEHAFGRTFICTNMEVARKVTFHPNVMTKSITLDGDLVDPSGTLSGGSAAREAPILVQMAEIKKLERQLDVKMAEYQRVADEINLLSTTAQKYNQIKAQIETLEYELKAIKNVLEQNSYQQHQQEIQDMQAKIESLKEASAKAKQDMQTATAKVDEIQANLADAVGYRDRQLKEAKENMNRLKQKSDQSQKNWKKHEQEAETLKLEIEELKKTLENSVQEAASIEEKIESLEQKVNLVFQCPEIRSNFHFFFFLQLCFS